jgi:DNA processing protein
MNKYWIWLSSIPYIGPITANLLLERFNKPENIYNAHIQEVCDSGLVSKKQAEMIARHHSLDKANDIIEQCYAKDIKILTIQDDLYPSRAIMHDAPVVLYYKGRLKNLGQTVGIVGARRCTREARHKAIEIAEEYSLNNISVISGIVLYSNNPYLVASLTNPM